MLPPLIGDLHCHTIASVHAYSTLRENIEAAKKKGLRVLGITDHACGMPDSPSFNYFNNLTSLPCSADGIRLLRDVEANIMDFEGKLDLPDEVLSKLDFVIAPFHTACIRAGSVDECTNAYLRLADNPYVRVIGHSDTSDFAYDYERVIPALGSAGKVLEINAHTFICRQDSVSNCRRVASLCMRHNLPVLVNSDAHSEFEAGACAKALEMLQEIGFPQELILKVDEVHLNAYLDRIGVQVDIAYIAAGRRITERLTTLQRGFRRLIMFLCVAFTA